MSNSPSRKHSRSHRRDGSRHTTRSGAAASSSSSFPPEVLDDYVGPSDKHGAGSWSHESSGMAPRKSSHSGIDRLHERLPKTTISDLSPPRSPKKVSSKSSLSQPSPQASSSKDLECQLCKKTFYQKINLKRHIREVHQNIKPDEGPESERRCETCNKVLRHKRSLKSHQATHNPTNPANFHSCAECGVNFNRKTNLNRHTKSVHGRHR